MFHGGWEVLIIIYDRPCKYKIKSKSLVTEFKFTCNKGKAIDSRSGLSIFTPEREIIYRSTWPMCTQ